MYQKTMQKEFAKINRVLYRFSKIVRSVQKSHGKAPWKQLWKLLPGEYRRRFSYILDLFPEQYPLFKDALVVYTGRKEEADNATY